MRRRPGYVARLWALAFMLAAAASGAVAQGTFPARPVRVVVPFPAGTSPDIIMRIVAPRLSETWGQQMIVENRAGASGIIGTEAVAKSPADGHTVLYTINSVICANPHMYAKLPYDGLKSFTPVSLFVNLGYVLIGRPDLPATTMRELVEYAKAHPGKLTYASAGGGSGPHIVMELLAGMAGISMLHVPGRAQATPAVLSGEVDLTLSPYTTGVPVARGGKARVFGVTLGKRLPSIPDVPTVAETLPGFVGDAWHGLFVPAGTPLAAVERLAADFARVLVIPDVRRRLEDLGLEPVGSSPTDFGVQVRADYEKWGRVIRAANIRLD